MVRATWSHALRATGAEVVLPVRRLLKTCEIVAGGCSTPNLENRVPSSSVLRPDCRSVNICCGLTTLAR